MTDPARTTKDELLPCPFCGAAALLEDDDAGCMNDQCILVCFAYPLERWNQRADAADALRAQVAALQAENERLRKLCDERWAQVARAETELDAAQAKLAMPGWCCFHCGESFTNWGKARDHFGVQKGDKPTCQVNAKEYRRLSYLYESAQKEIAALRTKAEALERERAWLDSNTTFYDAINNAPVEGGNVPTLASVSKRIWYHATDDQDSYPFSAVIASALAEGPVRSDIADIAAEHRSKLYDAEKP